jgi:hypothetical protein
MMGKVIGSYTDTPIFISPSYLTRLLGMKKGKSDPARHKINQSREGLNLYRNTTLQAPEYHGNTSVDD